MDAYYSGWGKPPTDNPLDQTPWRSLSQEIIGNKPPFSFFRSNTLPSFSVLRGCSCIITTLSGLSDSSNPGCKPVTPVKGEDPVDLGFVQKPYHNSWQVFSKSKAESFPFTGHAIAQWTFVASRLYNISRAECQALVKYINSPLLQASSVPPPSDRFGFLLCWEEGWIPSSMYRLLRLKPDNYKESLSTSSRLRWSGSKTLAFSLS